MPGEKTYYVIGLMSGSSLDGLDVAYCKIISGELFSFDIIHAHTFHYAPEIKKWLSDIPADIEKDYSDESRHFGNLCSDCINIFIAENQIKEIDFIASHGHTVFHFPEKKITCQIGSGAIISQRTHCDVICNFRQKDIDAGGQGAPLVPIADELFFSDHDACLNIGGIANISFRENERRIGFDICAANQLLNACAKEMNREFDENGEMARSGEINVDLLSQLNAHAYFANPYPKSMDNNDIRKTMLPLLQNANLPVEDKLATATEHIATQISNTILQQIAFCGLNKGKYSLLITGGGAYNQFLMESIKRLSGINFTLPANQIIEYKEALAMCLMGVLRRENKFNFIPSVTGAKYAVSGGDIYLYNQR